MAQTLGEISWLEKNLTKYSFKTINLLHKIAFNLEGSRRSRRRLKDWEGFTEEVQISEVIKIVNSHSEEELRDVCYLLRADSKGTKEDMLRNVIESLQSLQELEQRRVGDDVRESESEDGSEEGEENIQRTQREWKSTGDIVEKLLVQNENLIAALNIKKDEYCVMPDFNKNVKNFNGKGPRHEALFWLQSINSLAGIHRWPKSFKLEVARGSLVGAAKNWYLSREITNWEDFEKQFKRTYIGKEDPGTLWKEMLGRVQQKAEDVEDYLQDKMRMCKALRIPFEVAKAQLIEGLWSRELSDHLLARDHQDADELRDSVVEYEKINMARRERINKIREHNPVNGSDRSREARRTYGNNSANIQRRSPENHNPKYKFLIPNEGKTEKEKLIKCFSCGKGGHISRDCPTSQTKRICWTCGKGDHSSKECPQSKRKEEGMLVGKVTADPLAATYIKDATINDLHKVKSFIDTGSSTCMARASTAIRCQLEIEPYQVTVHGFGENAVTVPLGRAWATISVDGVRVPHCEIVVVTDKSQPYDMIIGRSWTEALGIVMTKVEGTVKFDYVEQLPLAGSNSYDDQPKSGLVATDTVHIPTMTGLLIEVETAESVQTQIPVANYSEKDVTINKGDIIVKGNVIATSKDNEETTVKNCLPLTRDLLQISPDLPNEKQEELFNLLKEYRDCFALNLSELGTGECEPMEIILEPGTKPITSKPYRASWIEREQMKEIVQEWRDNGIVEDTKSPFSSPVLLVKKKNGENRLVVDYRKLNAKTERQTFPLPNIDDLIEKLANSNMFTVLDLAHGYLQIPLSDEAKNKTAFVTPDDSGQFVKMIFGLMNAPYWFSRAMHTILGPLKNSVVVCYMDDLLIPSKGFEEMMCRLRLVLDALRKGGLTLKPSKCLFAMPRVTYLGFELSENGVQPGDQKVKAIREYPPPTNIHEVRRFLGLVSFFRRFVVNFAKIADPITLLTKKNVKFAWNVSQIQAFETLKNELTKSPTLAIFDRNRYTELHTDASSLGIAGMLLQNINGQMKLVYCVSKKTNDAEKKYHSTKLELMAIVWSLDRLRVMLLGIPVVVVTDCQALIYLNKNKTKSPQMARWFDLIQEYDVEIKHRPGERMAHVDALSRAPVDPPDDIMENVLDSRLDVLITLTEEDHILVMQYGDKELRDVIEKLKNSDLVPEKKNYLLRNGLLFHRDETDEKLRWVVPKSMRKSLVVKYHDLSGHFAVDRTVEKIKQNYYFPRMRRYVKYHITYCPECVLHKTSRGKQPGELHPIFPGKRPFSTINVDHVGPLTRSSKGNCHILVIVDNLTKYTKLYSVKNTSSRYVLKSLKSFVWNYGLPERIISDRGTCFTSKEFEEYCTINGVYHSLISVRHPQANGQVERINAVLIPVIQTAIIREKDWDKEMERVECHLNNAFNKTTGKTPFQLLYGYNPNFNDGALRRIAQVEQSREDPQTLQDLARRRIVEEQHKWKEKYDKHHVPIQYNVGEVVFLRRPPTYTGEPTKLQPKFKGPLVITEKLRGDTYRISSLKSDSNNVYATTAHVSQLKGFGYRKADVEEEPETNLEGSSNSETEGESDAAEVIVRPARNRRRPTRLDDYV